MFPKNEFLFFLLGEGGQSHLSVIGLFWMENLSSIRISDPVTNPNETIGSEVGVSI